MPKDDQTVCQICGKAFETESELVNHEITAHPNVGRGAEKLPGRPGEEDQAA